MISASESPNGSPRNRSLVIVDVVVTQSSDQAFHCLAITIFYADKV
jgi:hypothetical protein